MHVRFKHLILISLPVLFWAILSIPMVRADPAAILHVSLIGGTYIGSNPDPWFNEGWYLSFFGTSASFQLNITDVSDSITSYDTRLVIALDNDARSNLVKIEVDSTELHQSDFQNGSPQPYGLWNWPNGDVYPTWFNDTLVNVGTIAPKHSIVVDITATFSSSGDYKMHFDAWGSECTPPPPSKVGKITHSPLSEDSTVEFKRPPHGVPEFDLATPIATSIGAIVLLAAKKLRQKKHD